MIIFETATEFFDACEKQTIPRTIYVVFEGDEWVGLSGKGSSSFELSEEITQDEMSAEAFRRAKTSLYFT